MDVLLLPAGSAGDVFPFVGLGERLRGRGHSVVVASAAPFRADIEAAGLEYVELATREDFDRIVQDREVWHPMRGFPAIARHAVLPYMRAQYDCVARVAAERPGLEVVHSALGMGARIAHEAMGIPLTTLHLQPTVLWSRYASPKMGAGLFGPWVPAWLKQLQFDVAQWLIIDPTLRSPVNAWRVELGLEPARHVYDLFHSPQRVIGMFPAWFSAPQPDWPPNVELADFPLWDRSPDQRLDPELAAFLAEGPPPWAFTPGSAMAFGKDFFAAAADACRRGGRRGLLVTRYSDQVPRALPDGVRHVSFVPFSLLFPRVAGIVHHGGIGTTSQAFAAGVPQVIMPMSHDQPDNAARVRALGVGEALAPSRFTGRRLARILARLEADSQVPARCRALAARTKGSRPDGLDQACAILERDHAARTPHARSAINAGDAARES